MTRTDNPFQDNPARAERRRIARKRLESVLRRHTVALARTLEQEIADAGPYNQRIDPHILTNVRQQLEKEKYIYWIDRPNARWFTWHDADRDKVEERLAHQEPLHNAVSISPFTMRMGQTGEIAVYRALGNQEALEYFGRFTDLGDHRDDRLYSKEEPPGAIGHHQIPDSRRVDFLVRSSDAGWATIEVKNVREWLYPRRREVNDLLQKSLHLNAVPILIGRRVPYVTRYLLQACGACVWETYNQLYPESDHDLANRARHKLALGYHDIRVGNSPSPQLDRFLGKVLPEQLPEARDRFDDFKDLLSDWVFGKMSYNEFSALVRRREGGTNEDSDWNEY